MTPKSIFIFYILFSFVFQIYSGELKIVRIKNPDKSIVDFCVKNDFDIASYVPGKYIDIVTGAKEDNILKSNGINFTVYKTEEDMKRNLSSGRINGYHSYNDVKDKLNKYESENSDICKVYDIGDSWGKIYYQQGKSTYSSYQHDILAIKISDNVEEEEDEPNLLIMGAHHAREPIGTEMVMAILENLIDNYGSDVTVNDIINNNQIWIVPIVNPDGHKVVYTQKNTMWRKTIRDNNNNSYMDVSSGGYDGVDPNRNYGYKWGGAGTSSNPASETYKGPKPFSEPEIQAVRDLLKSRHFVAIITYHSYSELVLYPYGYTTGAYPPDEDALNDLAVEIASFLHKDGWGTYTPQPAYDLYPCSGTTDDYAYGMFGSFCFTIELATEFIPPASKIPSMAQDNVKMSLSFLTRTERKILRGHVIDGETGEPVAGAVISIPEIDNKGEPRADYVTDSLYGAYYRLLTPGKYDVKITADGYYDTTFENIEIYENKPTILDVKLWKIGSKIKSKKEYIIKNNKLFVENNVTCIIYNASGKKIFVSKNRNGYNIDLNNIIDKNGIYFITLLKNNKPVSVKKVTFVKN